MLPDGFQARGQWKAFPEPPTPSKLILFRCSTWWYYSGSKVWFRLLVHWLKPFRTLPGLLLVSLLLITSCLFPRISKFAHNPQNRSTPGVYIFFSRCKKKSSSSGLVSSPCLAPTPDPVILISLNNLSWASCQKIFCNFPLNFYMAHFWNT